MRAAERTRVAETATARPIKHAFFADTSPQNQAAAIRSATALACLGAMLSPMIVESDLYRYGGALIVGLALFERPGAARRPAMPVMGWLTLAFALLVALRYGATAIFHADSTGGSAEGIYLFPALYPVVAFMLLSLGERLKTLVWPMIALCAAALAATLEPRLPEAGLRQAVLFHNNTIHAGIGCGFILIIALAAGIGAAREPAATAGRSRLARIFLAALTAGLAAFAAIAAQSRGVWLALAGALPVLLVLLMDEKRSGPAIRLGLVFACCLLIAAAAMLIEPLRNALAPLGIAIDAIAELIASGETIGAAVRQSIVSGDLPTGVSERLQLIVNAIDIWSRNWIFGTGVYWERLFADTPYGETPHRLMHNGYLEIVIRYGLVGLAFFAGLALWCVRQAGLCRRAGLITREAHAAYVASLVFFALTLATNSNNRLAIGEAYMLLAGGYGFYCHWIRSAGAGRRAPS